MNAICHYVNLGKDVILLGSSGDTSTLPWCNQSCLNFLWPSMVRIQKPNLHLCPCNLIPTLMPCTPCTFRVQGQENVGAQTLAPLCPFTCLPSCPYTQQATWWNLHCLMVLFGSQNHVFTDKMWNVKPHWRVLYCIFSLFYLFHLWSIAWLVDQFQCILVVSGPWNV